MEGYLSIREAAEKWGVSQRRINQYCAEGRIPGAERFGGSRAIPENARKPGDPRREKKKAGPVVPQKAPELFHGFMPLMNTPFRPGHCMEAIEGMKAGPRGTSPWRSITISAARRKRPWRKRRSISRQRTRGCGFPPAGSLPVPA